MLQAYCREKNATNVLTIILLIVVAGTGCKKSAEDEADDGDTSTIVDVGGSTAGQAPAGDEAATLLRIATRFYGAQRCGNAHNWLIENHELGGSCHERDGQSVEKGLDLSGGWHDAGDHIKVSSTIAFAAYSMLKSYDAFAAAHGDVDDGSYSGVANGIPDVIDEAKVATDYLLKIRLDDGRLVALVGGEEDHQTFVTSPYQSTLDVSLGGEPRVVHTDGGPDTAGIAATALALMARLYQPFDPGYAGKCLAEARRLYDFAMTHAQVAQSIKPFYDDATYQDDQFCAAVELYRVTSEEDYLVQAKSLDAALGAHTEVSSWFNPVDLCRHSLAKADLGVTLDFYRDAVERYLESVSTDDHVRGLAYFWDWGTLNPALSAAFSASLFYDLTCEEKYRDFALSQLAYATGANEYNRSFVVGFGKNPPRHPHHGNAYGYDELVFDPSHEHRHELVGALVGGPSREAHDGTTPGYTDNVLDYVDNEVTLDYNSGLVGTAAFAVYVKLAACQPR